MVLPNWNVDAPADYQYIEKLIMHWPDRNGKEPLKIHTQIVSLWHL